MSLESLRDESHAPAGADVGPEELISGLLRLGVVLSLTLVTAGMAITFFHHPDYFLSVQSLGRLRAPQQGPHQLTGVLTDALNARGQAFVMMGLLVLMATPVLRVALSLLVFSRQHDRAFVKVTAGVLGLLLLSFVLGAAE